MRIKPTPLNEASLIFSITWLLTFLGFSLYSMDLNEGLKAASISIIFLVVSYVLWIVAGFWWRSKSSMMRFFMNLTVNSLVAVGALLLVNQAVSSATVDVAVVKTASEYLIAIATVFFLAATIASALTQFVLVKPKRE